MATLLKAAGQPRTGQEASSINIGQAVASILKNQPVQVRRLVFGVFACANKVKGKSSLKALCRHPPLYLSVDCMKQSLHSQSDVN